MPGKVACSNWADLKTGRLSSRGAAARSRRSSQKSPQQLGADRYTARIDTPLRPDALQFRVQGPLIGVGQAPTDVGDPTSDAAVVVASRPGRLLGGYVSPLKVGRWLGQRAPKDCCIDGTGPTCHVSAYVIQSGQRTGKRHHEMVDSYGLGELWDGGEAASWFSEMRAIARPARRAGPIVRPPRFRPEWADEGGPSTGALSIGRTPT
jgi:hypothetical protein